jgi:hypothetical protein
MARKKAPKSLASFSAPPDRAPAKAAHQRDGCPQFHDRDLASVNPNTTQFEPTPDAPVRQRYKMGGGA